MEAPAQEPPERPTKARRMRKPVSCVECRLRKIKCDRNVPNCSACIRRGIRHHCRWGDERDRVHASGTPLAYPSSAWNPPILEQERFGHALAPFPALPDQGSSFSHLYSNDTDEWRVAMENYIIMLPEPPVMDELVAEFLRDFEPLINCMHHSTFLEEYNTLKFHIAQEFAPQEPKDENGQSTRSKRSPQAMFWVRPENYGLFALLLAVLHVTCDAMERDKPHKRSVLPHCMGPKEFNQAVENLHTASTTFLHESQCSEHPTLWTLQTILLLQRRCYNMLLFPVGIVWNSLGLRIAQIMGLNRLGSAADDLTRLRTLEPKDESRVSELEKTMPWLREFAPHDLTKRELARKIWTALVTNDWLRSIHIDFSYTVAEEMNLTSAPASLSDEELARITTLPFSVVQDQNRVSPHTFSRIQLELARCVRDSSLILSRKMAKHEPPRIDLPQTLELDGKIRAIVVNLPKYFRFDGTSELSSDVLAIHAIYPYLTLQRLFIQEQIHYRILLLHAPHLQAAVSDPAHRRSLIACIEGACVVVTVWEELQRTNNPNAQTHLIKWHLVLAALVLDFILATIHASGNTTAPNDYFRLRSALRTAVKFLEDPGTVQVFKRLPQREPLGNIRRFCETEGLQEEQQGNQASHPPGPQMSLMDEFAMLGDAVPSSTDVGKSDDADLLASLDFVLQGDLLPIPGPALADTDWFSHGF